MKPKNPTAGTKPNGHPLVTRAEREGSPATTLRHLRKSMLLGTILYAGMASTLACADGARGPTSPSGQAVGAEAALTAPAGELGGCGAGCDIDDIKGAQRRLLSDEGVLAVHRRPGFLLYGHRVQRLGDPGRFADHLCRVTRAHHPGHRHRPRSARPWEQ